MNERVNYRKSITQTGRRFAHEYELPDPPENPEFLNLPEDVQERIAAKFEAGIKRTIKRADGARARAWGAWCGFVRRCQANREQERLILDGIRRKQR